MKENKIKSPKDIEKRKAKAKKIIFFILHGISYILSIMFIGALVIGGCSQKANTYKSANAAYSSEKLIEVDSIDLSNTNGYKYQFIQDNFTYNLPSYNVSKNYLGDWDVITINYNNVVSKSGQNVLTQISLHSWGLELFGDNVGDDSLFPNGFRINLTQLNNSTGFYDEQFYIEDIVNEDNINYISLSYVLSEFFDGTISILNYSSIDVSMNNGTLSDDNALKFFVFYFSQYSVIGANASIRTDVHYYLSLLGGVVDGNVLSHTLAWSSGVTGVKRFVVGDFSYGASLYNSIEIEYKTFDSQYKYFYRGRVAVQGYYPNTPTNAQPSVLYLNRVSFVNSISHTITDIISSKFGNYQDGKILTGYDVFPSSTSYIHYRNLAIYNSSNFNIVFFPDYGGNTYRAYRSINLRNAIFKIYNYSVSFTPTTSESLINVFDLIANAFGGLGGILSIAILPSLTIGTLFAIPIVMVFIIFIIKLFKR